MKKSTIQNLLFIFLFITIILFFTIQFKIITMNIPTKPENLISEENPSSSYLMLNGIRGKLLSTKNGDEPRLCSDDSGGAIICWANGYAYAQRINSSGDNQWPGDGITLAQSLTRVAAVDVCKDGEGGAIITWHGESNGDGYKNIYAQRVNSSGDFQWPGNWIPICTAVGGQATPRICSDGLGGAIIVWRDYRVGLDPSNTLCDVYAQRVNSSGQTQWTHNGILIADTNSQMNSGGRYARMISDGQEGSIIYWEDGGNIYAQKVNSTGNIQWAPNGLTVCGADGSQERPRICSDGLGGAYFVWEDDRPPYESYGDVYAQRVDSLGVLQWGNDGIPIMKSSEWQQYITPYNDGFGNALLTWSSDLRIFAQKINLNGTPLWKTPGIELGISDVSSELGICPDGKGGSFIAWKDFYIDNTTFHIQHINSMGLVNWKDDGYHMKHADIKDIIMLNDGDGGSIIAFSEYNSGYEIYTQIIKDIDDKPTTNNLDDVTIIPDSSRFINWTLQDDYGGGKYRVLTNSSSGDIIVWVNWKSWTVSEVIEVPINSSINEGTYFYTIEYYDDQMQLGLPDTVLVHVKTPSSPNITGYDLIIFFAISIFMTILIMRRKKRINSH